MIIEGEVLSYDIEKDSFFPNVNTNDVAKYLKNVFTNKNRFKSRFLNHFELGLKMYGREDRIFSLQLLEQYYDLVEPYSYKEAFEIKDAQFRSLVFGSINVGEMIKNLGHERIKTEGKNVTHKFYKLDGSFELKNYDVIYELHKVNCKELFFDRTTTDNDDDNYAYAVKCWCTTTNKEHWLWVETEYALKGPLEAIASTVRVYENMIPHIKEIKRQGDVLLFEMKKELLPEGKIVPLTADQYFNLLVAQS